MWNALRTFLLVTLITIMIWTFAEAESLTTKTVRIEVAFAVDPQTSRFVEVTENQGWNSRVEVEIEGSTALVNELESALRRGVSLRAGMPGIPAEPGEYTVDLNQALRAAPEIDGRGVTVVKVDPPNIKVVVDSLVTKEVKITTDVAGAVVDGAVETRPQRARLTLPSALAVRVGPETAVIARVPPEAIAKLVPGRAETIPGVTLTAPAGLAGRPRVLIDPDRADVVLTLRARTADYTIASVPVHIKIAAGEMGRWDVVVPEEDRFIRDVKVSGPSDLVDRVRRGDIRVTAVLSLSFDELERGITTKDVTFAEVPTELKFDTDRTTVRLSITRRETDPLTPPGS
ncbi:MAG TPA: hypothetical protein VK176_09880 [Phycisphaerales bacterium]|nr:hypothetical protein [Phycisphaerales bacterium]